MKSPTTSTESSISTTTSTESSLSTSTESSLSTSRSVETSPTPPTIDLTIPATKQTRPISRRGQKRKREREQEKRGRQRERAEEGGHFRERKRKRKKQKQAEAESRAKQPHKKKRRGRKRKRSELGKGYHVAKIFAREEWKRIFTALFHLKEETLDKFEEIFNSKAKKCYIPHREVVLDELGWPFRGQSKHRSYNPSKPHKWHLKFFGLVDRLHFCYKLIFAEGKGKKRKNLVPEKRTRE